MKAKPVTQNVEFAIGDCPLCAAPIIANATVDIDFKIGPVDYRSGKALVEVKGNPSFQRITVHHDCHTHDDEGARA